MRHVPLNERGFILIGAIWLLILCGSIAALLMLRGVNQGAVATREDNRLKRKLALESAVETVVAEILFNGPRSRWSLLPASGSVVIGERPIQIQLSSEAGRLDLNDGDLGQIDLALRGFGFAASDRGLLVDRLEEKRNAGQRISSWPEVKKLLASLPQTQIASSCLERELTLYSGLRSPQANQASANLANALGLATSTAQAPIEPGAALRIEASMPEGAALLAVVRITGTEGRPFSTMRWDQSTPCSNLPPQGIGL